MMMSTLEDSEVPVRLIRFVDYLDLDTAAVFDHKTTTVCINRYVYDRLAHEKQNMLLFTRSPKVLARWIDGACAISHPK